MSTQSFVEIKLLKKLFDKENAETALMLIGEQESVEEISSRTGRGTGELTEKLNVMAKKVLIMVRRKGDTDSFNLTTKI